MRRKSFLAVVVLLASIAVLASSAQTLAATYYTTTKGSTYYGTTYYSGSSNSYYFSGSNNSGYYYSGNAGTGSSGNYGSYGGTYYSGGSYSGSGGTYYYSSGSNSGNTWYYYSSGSYTPSRPVPQPSPQPTPQPTPQPAPQPSPTPGLSADEQRMIDLVNQERAKAGLAPLAVDMTLVDLARKKSQDMVANNYFSHTSPTYGDPFTMMTNAGVSYRTAGENIAGAPTVDQAHAALMNSAGHRQNILNPNYNKIGVGVATGGPYGKMFTQLFIGTW